jgi:hypothetical protein
VHLISLFRDFSVGVVYGGRCWCLYSDEVSMSMWQLKDGEDTVSEEPQCVSPRGRASAEENLLWGYRYRTPLFL